MIDFLPIGKYNIYGVYAMEENSCKTCRYFTLQCNNAKLTRGQKRRRYRLGGCQFWEPARPIESDSAPQQTLEENLGEIAKQLAVIADLLGKNQL